MPINGCNPKVRYTTIARTACSSPTYIKTFTGEYAERMGGHAAARTTVALQHKYIHAHVSSYDDVRIVVCGGIGATPASPANITAPYHSGHLVAVNKTNFGIGLQHHWFSGRAQSSGIGQFPGRLKPKV